MFFSLTLLRFIEVWVQSKWMANAVVYAILKYHCVIIIVGDEHEMISGEFNNLHIILYF